MVGQNKNIINYCLHMWETSLHKQTPGYQKNHVSQKIRIFVCFKSKDSEFTRLRKWDMCATIGDTILFKDFYGVQTILGTYH